MTSFKTIMYLKHTHNQENYYSKNNVNSLILTRGELKPTVSFLLPLPSSTKLNPFLNLLFLYTLLGQRGLCYIMLESVTNPSGGFFSEP